MECQYYFKLGTPIIYENDILFPLRMSGLVDLEDKWIYNLIE